MKKIYTLLIFTTLLLAGFPTFSQLATNVQKGTITGKIVTSDGEPAIAVTVQIIEINRKTITNENGNYAFHGLKNGEYKLTTSHTGLKVQTKKIVVEEGKTVTLDFILSENAAQLDEIVISSYKSSNSKTLNTGKIGIPARDLPQSVQTISSQVISDQQANRLGDVLKNVNGIALGANRGSVGENFYARGYSLGANNVFKNGARTTIGGIPEASTLESVEILKGSAALLYGGVSGGAVVNMITKKPKFDYGAEVSMRLGSYNLYKPTVDIYGPISEKLAFRVISTYETAGSYRDHVESKRFYVNPSLLYRVSEKTEIILQGDYLKSNYTPDFGIGTVGNKISPLSRSVYINTDFAYNNTITSTGQLNVIHRFNEDWKINFIASLQSYKRDYFSTERPFASADGLWNRALTRSNIDESTYNQQLNLTGSFSTNFIQHTLLIGIDADQSEITTAGFTNPNSNGPANGRFYDTVNLLNPTTFHQPTNFNTPTTNKLTNTLAQVYRMGGFVQDLLALTDQFKVLAGIRWSFQKTPTTTINTLATNIFTKGTVEDKIDKAFSPKVGLVYQPLKNTSIYASYSNNFTSNSGIDINTNAPMDPSIIDQYEGGIKNDFLNGRLSANVTYYKIKNDKFAQTAVADATKREFSGGTESDGIEIDLSGNIVKGLNFLAGYSYNYMRYTSTLENTGIVEGERLVGTTKNTVNGTLFYTFPAGSLKGLKLGASAFYVGERFGGRNTTKNNSSSGIIPIEGFSTFDFSAGYSYKKFTLLTKLSNITNELNYYVHENYSVNPIPPRQFSATLGYKF